MEMSLRMQYTCIEQVDIYVQCEKSSRKSNGLSQFNKINMYQWIYAGRINSIVFSALHYVNKSCFFFCLLWFLIFVCGLFLIKRIKKGCISAANGFVSARVYIAMHCQLVSTSEMNIYDFINTFYIEHYAFYMICGVTKSRK